MAEGAVERWTDRGDDSNGDAERARMRAWAVPLVIPIPRAWQAFDREGHVRDAEVERQLHSLGAEVARAALVVRQARVAERRPLTTADATRAATAVEGRTTP